MKKYKTTDRKLAYFLKHFKANFMFLESAYDFEIVSERLTGTYAEIRYQSKTVYLKSFYGPPDFSLDFTFGRIEPVVADEVNGFSSSDLLSPCDEKSKSSTGIMASNVNALKTCLPKLAELLQKRGTKYLQGSNEAYEQLIFICRQKSVEWSKSVELHNMRSALAKAWEAKDYQTVYLLLLPFEHDLKKSEQLKLKIAKKKLNKKP